MSEFTELKPSVEQLDFINRAKSGENILVDACIGSGKTTAIQKLCNSLPSTTKILYLTYNKLLKLDAQSKIKLPNATVQNYHGFAYLALSKNGLHAGVSDLIQTVLKSKPKIPIYDLLIIDEYQDIELETSLMLEFIKSTNPDMQIIAVGDMKQKIYDKTTLDVWSFITKFLGEHTELEFTQCFRLSEDHAAELGRIWDKKIIGVNSNCKVERMTRTEVVKFLSQQNTEDIMCLGSRNGAMSKTLNTLENYYPDKFNKFTVYASISEKSGAVSPKPTSAIFTTFDSSKGMERDICVVFDYDAVYWATRLNKPQQNYQILKNIFLVAASRGKKQIIFVEGEHGILDEQTMSTPPDKKSILSETSFSGLFEFKYREDIEEAYSHLKVKIDRDIIGYDADENPIDNPDKDIIMKLSDGLIDLSPCISVYQMASYFDNFNIDSALAVEYHRRYHEQIPDVLLDTSMEEKVLMVVAYLTNQTRYKHQVELPFVMPISEKQLHSRISEMFPRNADAQAYSSLTFARGGVQVLEATGFADVLTDDSVYQLIYATEISHDMILECACHMLAHGRKKGVVWNTRTNDKYHITIKNKQKLKNSILRTATKGYYSKCD